MRKDKTPKKNRDNTHRGIHQEGIRKGGSMEKKATPTERFRRTSMRLRSHSDLLSKHMRKCVVSLIHRSLVHLEQATATPRRRSGRSGGRRRRRALGGLAALPADPAALEHLLATIEQHLELGIADDPALARSGTLHDFDVLALELEKLGGHFRDRLPRFARLGAAADWHLELA